MLRRGDLIGVTGASGTIGRQFCKEALVHGYRVRGFGRTPAEMCDGAEKFVLDLMDGGDIDPELFRDCNAIVHCAAYIPTDHKSLAEAEKCWKVNVLGTVRLIRAMAKAKVPFLVQMSSANAYSLWGEHTGETAPMFPASRTFYLSSKIAQEIVAMEACEDHAILLSTLRVSSVYGSNAGKSIIARFASKLLAGEPIDLIDEGRFGADFVFGPDVARAALMVLEQGLTGELNVASGRRTLLCEIASELRRLIGVSDQLIRLVPARKNVDRGFPAIRIGRARALGFMPTPMTEALSSVVMSLQSREASASGE